MTVVCSPYTSIILRLARIMCVDWKVDFRHNYDALVSIIGYTNISDPWTSYEASSEANLLLSAHKLDLPSDTRSGFITNTCLDGFLRAIFSSPTPGCRNIDPMTYSSPGRPKVCPWKTAYPHAFTVMVWTVTHAEVCLPSISQEPCLFQDV
jgi:hypothetical protein